LYWSGAGAGSSSGPANGSLANAPTISAKYTDGSGSGLVFFVTGATGADAASSGSQQGSTGSTTLTLADGQSTVTTTPLVYQPGSDDGPGVVTAVWTGDDGGWQVVLISERENSSDDGAPDGEPQGDPRPLRLPPTTGWSQFTSMREPGWEDYVHVFRPIDVKAERELTGLAKMIDKHGPYVSSRAVDSAGRVIRYTFANGITYMEPVEPPSEQYIDSIVAMAPGGIALRSGKGVAGASRAIAAEIVEDALANRAGQAADDASGGRLGSMSGPLIPIILGARPKPKPGIVGDVAEATQNAGTAAARSADDVAEAAGRGAAAAVPNSASAKGLKRATENLEGAATSLDARRRGSELAGLGEDSVPFISDVGPQKGWAVGRQSTDGLRGWRMDWDPQKGYHVNWWDRTSGAKRKDWLYGSITIDGGTWDDYIELLKHGFGN